MNRKKKQYHERKELELSKVIPLLTDGQVMDLLALTLTPLGVGLSVGSPVEPDSFGRQFIDKVAKMRENAYNDLAFHKLMSKLIRRGLIQLAAHDSWMLAPRTLMPIMSYGAQNCVNIMAYDMNTPQLVENEDVFRILPVSVLKMMSDEEYLRAMMDHPIGKRIAFGLAQRVPAVLDIINVRIDPEYMAKKADPESDVEEIILDSVINGRRIYTWPDTVSGSIAARDDLEYQTFTLTSCHDDGMANSVPVVVLLAKYREDEPLTPIHYVVMAIYQAGHTLLPFGAPAIKEILDYVPKAIRNGSAAISMAAHHTPATAKSYPEALGNVDALIEELLDGQANEVFTDQLTMIAMYNIYRANLAGIYANTDLKLTDNLDFIVCTYMGYYGYTAVECIALAVGRPAENGSIVPDPLEIISIYQKTAVDTPDGPVDIDEIVASVKRRIREAILNPDSEDKFASFGSYTLAVEHVIELVKEWNE